MRKVKKSILGLAVLISLIVSFLIFKSTANAAIETFYTDSNNTYTLKEDGKPLMTLQMIDGTIYMTADSATASSGIRYRTIGLAITRYPITDTTTTKGYTGPTSVWSAVGATATVYFNEDNVSQSSSGGRTITTKWITKDEVSAAFEETWGKSLDEIKKDQILYFHAIFESYDAETGIARKKTPIMSWYDIMNQEWWGESSLEGFYKYYNMYLKFAPGPQKCQIMFQEFGSLISIKPTETLWKDPINKTDYEIGNTVEWKDKPATIEYEGKTYKLIKNYVTLGKGTDRINEQGVTNDDVTKLQSGSYSPVPYGGVVVHLIYQEGAEPNKMTYKTTGGTVLKDEEKLEDAKVDTSLNWENKYSSFVKTAGTYQLIKYEVVSNATGKLLDSGTASTYAQIAGIQKGSIKVPLGGVTVNNIYDIVKQKNDIIYETVDGAQIKKSALTDMEIGKYVSWSGVPDTYSYNSKTYEIYGCYVISKADATKTRRESKTIDDHTKASIEANMTKVVLGGIEVHIIYKLPSEDPPDIPVIPTEPDVPQADSVTEFLSTAESTGTIQADNRYANKFDVSTGVPTTESLYTEAYSTEYLMGYDLQKKVGTKTYNVKVQKKYILQWKIDDGTGKMITKTEETTVTQNATVKRSFGYWEINNFDLYRIGYATINNYALPGGSSMMSPNYGAGYSYPSVSVSHSASEDYHIVLPKEIKDGITLPTQTVDGGTTKPVVPEEDLTVAIDDMVPKLSVQSDSLIINGTTVMSSAVTLWNAPDINKDYLKSTREAGLDTCKENVLYKNNQIIDATKSNGVFPTNGNVTYVSVGSVNSKYGYSYNNPIYELSPVTIHTPVFCQVSAGGDNSKYVQLLKPTNAVQTVLDPDPTYNDFTVSISNTGFHTGKLGYGSRDYSKSLRDPSLSYIKGSSVLRNEVKFPFDVYILQGSSYIYVLKNTWVVLGRSTGTFHLPMWVTEGIYTVKCRTVAVNATEASLDQTSEYRANTQLNNYVATDNFSVEVSGRIYGLEIYDITDYPIWEEAFRIKDSLRFKINDSSYMSGVDKSSYNKAFSYNYALGTKDQYGKNTGRLSKYTFPLINGSHPFYSNIGTLKPGYAVRFKVTTQGSMFGSGNYVKITPSFYYVDKDGKNRTAVDLYYTETISGKTQSLVKIGSTLDKTNVKSMETGSPYIGIPAAALKNTASILGITYPEILNRKGSIFTYSLINITTLFRTFTNLDYMQAVTGSSQYPPINSEGISTSDMVKQEQNWYGSYYLPSEVHAVEKGYDVLGYAKNYGVDYKESFWKKNGYIIVNFDIVTVDSTGAERLSYINADNYLNNGNLSMWVTEGPVITKKDNTGATFNFKAGDFIMYSTDDSAKDDYTVGGLY